MGFQLSKKVLHEITPNRSHANSSHLRHIQKSLFKLGNRAVEVEKILLSQKLTKDQTALLEATKKNRLQISPLNPKNINMKSISNHQHDLLRNNQQLKRYEKFIEQERKILSNHYDTSLNYYNLIY